MTHVAPAQRSLLPITRNRRAALRELGGILLAIAVPVGAVFLTATPIPNPPSRALLNVLSPARMEAIRKRQEADAARRRATAISRRRASKNPRPRDSKTVAERRVRKDIHHPGVTERRAERR